MGAAARAARERAPDWARRARRRTRCAGGRGGWLQAAARAPLVALRASERWMEDVSPPARDAEAARRRRTAARRTRSDLDDDDPAMFEDGAGIDDGSE